LITNNNNNNTEAIQHTTGGAYCALTQVDCTHRHNEAESAIQCGQSKEKPTPY